MALPDLPTALRQADGNPRRAGVLARNAAAAVSGQHREFNTFISVDAATTPKRGRKSDALLGCVFSVKDNIEVAGWPFCVYTRSTFSPAGLVTKSIACGLPLKTLVVLVSVTVASLTGMIVNRPFTNVKL